MQSMYPKCLHYSNPLYTFSHIMTSTSQKPQFKERKYPRHEKNEVPLYLSLTSLLKTTFDKVQCFFRSIISITKDTSTRVLAWRTTLLIVTNENYVCTHTDTQNEKLFRIFLLICWNLSSPPVV